MYILEAIDRGTKYWANKIAIISEWGSFTFREIDERVNRLANGLMRLGCHPGCHIGVILNNCHQYIEIYFAKHKLNTVWVTLSGRMSEKELAWQINDAEIGTILVGEEYLGKVETIKTSLKTVQNYIAVTGSSPGFISYEELISSSTPERPKVEVKGSDLSRISYTGGTTGRPKGLMISRRSDEAVMRNILLDSVADLHRRDVFLALQPFYHAVWTYALPCWLRGATQILTPHWSPQNVCETIEKERVTIVKTVPTLLVRLLDYQRLREHDLSSLRTIIYGGAPMPVEKLKQLIELLGPIFVGNYGQAEAPMTIATLSKKDHLTEDISSGMKRLHSAGRPYTFVDVKIVDHEGKKVPTGELGEVIVKGDHIMTDYWHRHPEIDEEPIKEGWVHTRDIGFFDNEGFLYLVDRKSEMIITGGFNVYPNEVEQVLCMHPSVQEAAVVGIPDEEWGESIKAFVVVKPGKPVTEQELIDFVKDYLASYKKPKSVEFRDNLPKSDVGKILRRVLREPYWKGREKNV